jgi:tetratricopeptide (TPR) repeat protein
VTVDTATLVPLIIAFVQLGTRDDMVTAVRARPELLSAEADDAFEALRAQWERAGSALATTTTAHLRALRAMRALRDQTLAAAPADAVGQPGFALLPDPVRAAFLVDAGDTAGDPERRAIAWTLLGHLRLDQYEATAETARLDEAETAYRAALDLTAPGSEREPGRLSHLAAALLHRWRRHGHAPELDQAVELLERAGTGNVVALNNLGSALLERFERDGNADDLDRAVHVLDRAVRMEPPGTSDHRLTRANLATALRRRHDLHGTGDTPADETVAEARAALAAANAVQRPGLLDNLGTALSRVYEETGDVRALEELVHAYEDAVAATPPGSPRLPIRLANLGDALRDRYVRIGTAADLDRAVDLLDRALALTPAHAPSRRDRLAASAVARLQRFRTGMPGDLVVAADRARAALAATPERSPDRPARLGLRAACLQELAAVDPESLDRAVDMFQQSVDATPATDPMYARHLHNLGQATGHKARVNDDPAVRENAYRLLRRAWRTGATQDPAAGVSAGLASGLLAADDGDWATAAEGYMRALAAVSALVGAQQHRRAKEGWLREAQGVPARAADALVRRGLTAEAVLVLESGRAALLTEQLRTFRR